MADNIAVLDANGASKTMKTDDVGGVHTPHHSITGKQSIIEVAMTPSTSVLASGDVAADTQVIAACMRGNDLNGILQSIVLVDQAGQAGILDIVFLNANNSLGTENGVVDLTAVESKHILYIQKVVASDYTDFVISQVATFSNIGAGIRPATGTDDMYVGIISRDTKTYTASSLILILTFIQN